jgi:hypothetical protein
MSYGLHQARSSEALAWLVTNPGSVPQSELTTVLTCRAALLAAHRERCARATHGADVRAALFKDRRDFRDFASIAQGGAVALSRILEEYPSFQSHTTRFTDVLGLEHLSVYSHAWVEAAKHAVLATADVTSSTSWTEHPGKAWTIVADVADAAEALTVLDRHLQQPLNEQLPDWGADLFTPSAGLRLVARHIGYVARAGDLDPASDAIERHEPLTRPVHLRAMGDVANGVQIVTGLLDGCELSVRDLRTFALMQSDIANTCAGFVTDPRLPSLRDSFLQREVQFRQLAGATTRVASIGPSSGRLVLGQTQEIGRVLLQARRSGATVSPDVLRTADTEQRVLGSTLAANVGRAAAEGRYLFVDDEDVALRWRRAEPGEALAVVHAAQRTAELEPTPLHPSRNGGVRQVPSAAAKQDAEPVAVSAEPSRHVIRSALDRQPYWHRPPMPNRRPSVRSSMGP